MIKTGNIEHDREATENKLIVAIGQMIEENGFEKIGIMDVWYKYTKHFNTLAQLMTEK